jgi:hypothetical protein
MIGRGGAPIVLDVRSRTHCTLDARMIPGALPVDLDDLESALAQFPSELSPRTFCTFLRELSSRRRTPRILLEELSGLSERPMIIRMTTTSRPQQRYDHRLRDLVQRTGDLTITTDLGVPRSTARGWLRAAPTMMVSLEVGTSRSTNSGRRS